MAKVNLSSLRAHYTKGGLGINDVDKDPITQFTKWMNEALDAEVPEPNAMTLSTMSPEGTPSGRVVLLKDITEGQFTFYTNYNSEKSQHIDYNSNVSLSFLWLELERQIRINGKAERVGRNISESYFHSRPRGSQIGAWVSPQSEVVSEEFLAKELLRYEKLYENKEVIPLPSHWGGFQVDPLSIEFWQGRPSRLHDRIRYKKSSNEWVIERLAP